MEIGVKKLNNLAKLPKFVKDGDVGLAVYAIKNYVIAPGDRVLVKTGIALEVPPGFEVQVRSRSGMAINDGVIVLNAPGTIEHTFKGEVGVILINTDRNETYIVNAGDNIAQLVVKPVIKNVTIKEVDTLSNSNRGSDGFGSTGR